MYNVYVTYVLFYLTNLKDQIVKGEAYFTGNDKTVFAYISSSHPLTVVNSVLAQVRTLYIIKYVVCVHLCFLESFCIWAQSTSGANK